jgi:protein-disulfide isomerase
MEADGVEGTPTIFVNGTKHANMAYEDLKAIIEAELAK